MGEFNTIDYENGYTMDGQNWEEDLKMPTRLGEETLILTLAKWEDGTLKPLTPGEKQKWRKSEIRVLEKNVSNIPLFNEEQQAAFEKIKQRLPNQGKWINLLPMVWNAERSIWQADVIDSKSKNSKIFYNTEQGLIYAYELEPLENDDQLETEELI